MQHNMFFLGSSNFPSKLKMQPLYRNNLFRYPKENPILMTADQYSLHFIRRLNGTCLFCPKNVDDYDLSFSFQCEVWILYSRQIYAAKALQLAQAIQQSGASKILAMWINVQSAKECQYDRH